MKPIPFVKMSALGNDFIVVDNREGVLSQDIVLPYAAKVCKARYSIGGDQLMLIEKAKGDGDYYMRTINPDGSEVKMCGNASRCVARYAFDRGIAGGEQDIETLGGIVRAKVDASGVRVGLDLTGGPELNIELEVLGSKRLMHYAEVSGAPHAVVPMDGAMSASAEAIHELGAAIRYHKRFPAGANVNFVEATGPRSIDQRTYERGIEGETFACGTGATASALVMGFLGLVSPTVSVRVVGGVLTVGYALAGKSASDVVLGGEARYVAEGTILPEAIEF